MKIDMTRTSRGFAIGRFKDRYDLPCDIQKSSLATEDCIWLGPSESRMHLTPDMAAALIPLLQAFVETGELPEPVETI